MTIKQVIVMRSDLGMRKGKMIAQGAHASMKVFLDRGDTGYVLEANLASLFKLDVENPEGSTKGMLISDLTPEMVAWVNGRFTKVCVQVKSEQELLDIVSKAEAAGLPVALIQDAGATEFHGVPTYTCCAIGPASAETIDPITGHLSLL